MDCSEFNGGAADLCNKLNANDDLRQADLNSFFIIWGATLVLFMHAGFAMLSAGALRTKNTKNILISTTMDLAACALAWYLCGFAFAFGTDRGGFIGSSHWVGIGVGSEANGTASFHFWLFQYCFAATSATIVAGAVAERARFETYLFYSFFLSFWLYPVVVHWVWGGGFLSLGKQSSLMGSGVVDFAGCGPVHMVGGLAGAIGSKIMGPRIGRFDPETRKPIPMPGHSSPLATLGTFILWVGWLGFNSGSVINVTGGGGSLAARAAVNTVLSSGVAALSALFFSHWTVPSNDYDLGMALNGVLAGLVSITGCAAYVEMWAAVAIGCIGGVVYVGSSRLTLNVLKIDDPLDATPVHFFCGMWGLIAGAFFVNPKVLELVFAFPDEGFIEVPEGVFYGGNTYITKFANGTVIPGGDTKGALVANAVVEIVCIIAWVTVFMLPLFLTLDKIDILRVPSDIESIGLDVSHHGGEAYPELFHAWNFPQESGGISKKKERNESAESASEVAKGKPSDNGDDIEKQAVEVEKQAVEPGQQATAAEDQAITIA